MNLIDILTPKDTEEIKPGLFIQKKISKDKVYYRQIEPMAWNGKINWKTSILGTHPVRNFLWFAIIMFLAWSYYHDNSSLLQFEKAIQSDPIGFCNKVTNDYLTTPAGQNFTINISSLTLTKKDGDTNSIQAIPR